MTAHPIRSEIDLLSGQFWAGDHHEAFTWMRAEAPVYFDPNSQLWAVTRYQDLKAVSTDPRRFSSAQGIRPESGPLPMMIDMDDPAHLRRRKLVNRGFTPRRVREQRSEVLAACDEIIDAICERGSADLVADIAAPLPMIMIGDALGVAPEDRRELLQWSDDMLSSLTGDIEVLERGGEAFNAYSEYASRVIADRRECPADDLMSVLVHAEVDGDRLDHDSLVQESLLILIGGDETTRHVISGGMYQLLVHHDQRARLAADPSAHIKGTVEEMLRWVSPIKNMARHVVVDTQLGTQRLAEGDKLLLCYPSANRDEAVFDDPFRFDIDREPNEHVAFGFGPHFCLGNSLARLEIEVMVTRLLERLPDIGLVDSAEPEARAANFISGYEAMPVTFSPTGPIG
ncbi:MAG TPA: cytochrome P450 [Acidimicrobiales bacterium]|nr:cytochrome P450 [Acidimicrobiales bacterium]